MERRELSNIHQCQSQLHRLPCGSSDSGEAEKLCGRNISITSRHEQEVKELESWIYNLTAANQNEMQNPTWFRQFTLREDFGLKDLSASSLNSFANSLPSNKSAIQQVTRLGVKGDL